MEVVRYWRSGHNYLNPEKYGYRPNPPAGIDSEKSVFQNINIIEPNQAQLGISVKDRIIFQAPNK